MSITKGLKKLVRSGVKAASDAASKIASTVGDTATDIATIASETADTATQIAGALGDAISECAGQVSKTAYKQLKKILISYGPTIEGLFENVIVRPIDEIEKTLHASSVTLSGFERSIQCDWWSCGAQSAFMILRYYHKAQSIVNVKKELKTCEGGTDYSNIKALFRRRGLIPRTLHKPTVQRIKNAIDDGFPVLICTNKGNHYAVVFGYGDKEIFVADPALPLSFFCAHSTRQFLKRWNKDAMVVEDPRR